MMRNRIYMRVLSGVSHENVLLSYVRVSFNANNIVSPSMGSIIFIDKIGLILIYMIYFYVYNIIVDDMKYKFCIITLCVCVLFKGKIF